MYPFAMREGRHPAAPDYKVTSTLALDDERLCFASVDATSLGALPVRTKDGLEFPHGRARFDATAHELRTGVELGTVRVHQVLAAYYCEEMQSFAAFVDHWGAEKLAAEVQGDTAARLFAKLILNSAYGKTGQDPRNYFEYIIRHPDIEPPPPKEKGWRMYVDHGKVEVWRKPATLRPGSFFDVAIAASITGLARSVLYRALHGARRPVYCDTDSIICEDIGGAPVHPSRLGAWKIEATGTRIAIAGKKTYALANGRKIVKYACKGVDIPPQQIFTIARGGSVDFYRDAPTMSIRGNSFVHRTVKETK
jgi:hypothetical protein